MEEVHVNDVAADTKLRRVPDTLTDRIEQAVSATQGKDEELERAFQHLERQVGAASLAGAGAAPSTAMPPPGIDASAVGEQLRAVADQTSAAGAMVASMGEWVSTVEATMNVRLSSVEPWRMRTFPVQNARLLSCRPAFPLSACFVCLLSCLPALLPSCRPAFRSLALLFSCSPVLLPFCTFATLPSCPIAFLPSRSLALSLSCFLALLRSRSFAFLLYLPSGWGAAPARPVVSV